MSNVSPSAPDWRSIVGQVARGDETAIEFLCEYLKGFRYYFRRGGGISEAEDLFQQLMLTVVEQIKDGKLGEPEHIISYVRTIAVQMLADYRRDSDTNGTHDRADEIDLQNRGREEAIRENYVEIAKRTLAALPPRDRSVLTRFYLDGETAENIQAEFNLSATQLRLIKSRAKGAFERRCMGVAKTSSRVSQRPIKRSAS